MNEQTIFTVSNDDLGRLDSTEAVLFLENYFGQRLGELE